MTVTDISAFADKTGVDTERLEIVSITSLAQHGHWRTAAMRSHAAPRLLWITRGQGRITLSGQTRGFGANNLIYIPPGTLHGYDVGVHTFGQQITLPLSLAGDWSAQPIHLRLRDVVQQKEFMSLLDNLERENASTEPGSDRAAVHHAGMISVFVERQTRLLSETTLPDSSAARLVRRYTKLIATEFHSEQGVTEYARKLNVTPTHLTRCCQQTCGRSALKLLNDRILFEARKQLSETSRPICEIASSLGFRSAAYFTRRFQAETGLTPSAFRAQSTLHPQHSASRH
ncbi:MAG: AraC family transcriptional regulator [Paracoccaceae bacterium]|nr:AraC family transcriptional regulator [Paracoccaceae bacterium]